MQAKARRGHEEAHALDAEAKVASQRHIGGAAIDAAIERTERGHAHGLEAVHHGLETVAPLRRPGRLAGRDRAQIVARAEGLLARAGQHRHPHGGVGVGLFDGFAQLSQPRSVEPVVLGRVVEGDGGPWAVDRQQNGVGHVAQG